MVPGGGAFESEECRNPVSKVECAPDALSPYTDKTLALRAVVSWTAWGRLSWWYVGANPTGPGAGKRNCLLRDTDTMPVDSRFPAVLPVFDSGKVWATTKPESADTPLRQMV